jgi:hypothetical protein
VEPARIDTVLDTGHAARLALAAGDLVLLVHSGSRGLGERLLRAHTEQRGARPAGDPTSYLAAHDEAVRWGSLNRRLIAARVAHALGARPVQAVVDQCHNLVEPRDGTHLHRKGAAPGDGRDVLVAGSRGSRSYLVAAHAGQAANFSVAHGAGRKMSRADALARGRAKHTVEELRRTPLGSLVVCGDRQLLFEEALGAYKRIDQVITDLVTHDLATPVLTTKDATRHGLGTQRLDALPGPRPGTYRSVLLPISGPGVTTFAATWTGTLCWQAPSPYRPQHPRKNWYVTARPCHTDPPRTPFDPTDVDIVACRTGGPGGQHRNKVSTAARAIHRPTGSGWLCLRHHGSGRSDGNDQPSVRAGPAGGGPAWRTT